MTTPTKVPTQPAHTETPGTSSFPVRRKFTVDEYYRMAEAGILHSDERVELIDGEIILMAPIGSRHGSGVARVTTQFVNRSAGAVQVWPQNSVHLGDDLELQPDIAILNPRDDTYAESNPRPGDILIIIEVSDTTLAYDRDVKSRIYAQANVPENWIMNLPEDCIESFTQPGPDGYAQHAIYRRGDTISPSTLPDVAFAVADLLPPAVEEVESQEAQSEGEPQT